MKYVIVLFFAVLIAAAVTISLLLVVRSSDSPQVAQQAESVRIDGTLYSVPSVDRDLPPRRTRVLHSDVRRVALHEDDWLQTEVTPSSNRARLNDMIKELRQFARFNKVRDKYEDVYPREPRPYPLTSRQIMFSELESTFLGENSTMPLFVSAGKVLAEVEGGFAIPIVPGGYLYGHRQGQIVASLGIVFDRNVEVDLNDIDALVDFTEKHQLLIVNWYTADITTLKKKLEDE